MQAWLSTIWKSCHLLHLIVEWIPSKENKVKLYLASIIFLMPAWYCVCVSVILWGDDVCNGMCDDVCNGVD